LQCDRPNPAPLDFLKELITGGVCAVGVGNVMRGDDGAGALVAKRFSSSIGPLCIDAGIVPENFLEKIVQTRAGTVLIVDAVDFDGAPGEIRVFETNDVAAGAISTHSLSIQMLGEYLKTRGIARVALIGIQPATTTLDAELTPAVDAAIDLVGKALVDLCRDLAHNKSNR